MNCDYLPVGGDRARFHAYRVGRVRLNDVDVQIILVGRLVEHLRVRHGRCAIVHYPEGVAKVERFRQASVRGLIQIRHNPAGRQRQCAQGRRQIPAVKAEIQEVLNLRLAQAVEHPRRVLEHPRGVAQLDQVEIVVPRNVDFVAGEKNGIREDESRARARVVWNNERVGSVLYPVHIIGNGSVVVVKVRSGDFVLPALGKGDSARHDIRRPDRDQRCNNRAAIHRHSELDRGRRPRHRPVARDEEDAPLFHPWRDQLRRGADVNE